MFTSLTILLGFLIKMFIFKKESYTFLSFLFLDIDYLLLHFEMNTTLIRLVGANHPTLESRQELKGQKKRIPFSSSLRSINGDRII